MRRSADFRRTVRSGARAGRSTLVVHYLAQVRDDEPTVVGFVVSTGVGNAVVRNKVKRRLRGLIADELERIPRGSDVVVRALPHSANASFAELKRDVHSVLTKLLPKTHLVNLEDVVR